MSDRKNTPAAEPSKKPSTCGTCRHFQRDEWEGRPLTTGLCLIAKDGTVAFRRQSSRACSRKERSDV